MNRKFRYHKQFPFWFTFFSRLGKPIYFGITLGFLYLIIFISTVFQNLFSIKKRTFRIEKKAVQTPTERTLELFSFIRSALKKTGQIIFFPIVLLIKVLGFLFRWRLVIFLLFLTSITAVSYYAYQEIFKNLPAPTTVSTKKPILTTKIFDRRGNELYHIYKDENRSLIKLDALPPHLIQATLAIEDSSFYSHSGFSVKGIIRAIKTNLTQNKVHGGSTITQQLVKNTLLTSEKKFKRKIREVVLAIAVDALYEKDEILEMYFNQIPYGGSTYGVEEAAQKYFGKSARDVSIAEAALLAGIPASPTVYSPFGANPELATVRQHEVVRRMVEEHYLTPEQADAVLSEKLSFVTTPKGIEAPHFVMYVRSLLAEMYGEEMVSQGGLEVYTTLDLDLQHQAQETVTTEVKALQQYKISNGAALITNPQTGEILSMIGSVDYFDLSNDGQVNLTTRPRQPGSSIKPLTYALALENGFTPSTTILDAPITYQLPGSQPYSPKNYDGKFHGQVTLRSALANSYNIPAVKTLATLGVSNVIDKAELMGIGTWKNRNRYGLSLTLGGGEVLMTDMAELYGVFANYGQFVELNPLLLIKDSDGKVIYENKCVTKKECESKKVLDPRVAYQISDILSDNQARSAAFGLNSVLYIPDQQVAVKTGTTNSLRDNWTIGYTTDRVVAVWVGNNDNSAMSYVASGITGASPIWNKLIRTQLNAEQAHVFAPLPDLNKVAICTSTGTLPCDGCPAIKEEFFIPGTEPKNHCSFEPKEAPQL